MLTKTKHGRCGQDVIKFCCYRNTIYRGRLTTCPGSLTHWYGCGSRVSFPVSLILWGERHFWRYIVTHQGRHCNSLMAFYTIYGHSPVTTGQQCNGFGEVCALWVLLILLLLLLLFYSTQFRMTVMIVCRQIERWVVLVVSGSVTPLSSQSK